MTTTVRGRAADHRAAEPYRPEIVSGVACFVDDVERPGGLSAAVVRSSVAHGRLVAVDGAAALRQPGVRAVLTAADLDPVPVIPIRSFARPGLEERRQPVLATDRVRYVGEPVALVVADDPYMAEDAAEAVSVEIEPLPAVLAPDELEAPALWDGLDNRFCSWEAKHGDVEGAFDRAATVVEETFHTGRRTGIPMETRGIVAEWSGDGRTLEVWGPTKFLGFTQRSLASWFGIDPGQVLCHRIDVGGMFGVRGELYPEDFLIPWAARVLRRPVKWIEDRREHLLAINHECAMAVRLALALDGQGHFLAMKARILVDMGAYTRPLGGRIPLLAIEELPGPYRWPAFGAIAEGRATTKTPVGTVRAPVALEGTFARERLIDIAAEHLCVDGAQLRRENLITPEELPFIRRYGPGLHDQRYDSGDFPAMLDALLDQADRRALLDERDARRARGELAGVGIGLFLAHSGLGEKERVSVTLADGELLVHSAGADMGQGLDHLIGLVVAESWGAPPPRLRVVSGTTIAAPQSSGTFASRSAIFVGSAVRDGCRRLLQAASEEAARRLDVPPDEVECVADGLAAGDGRTVAWSELGPLTVEGEHRDKEFTFGFGGHVALVTVARDTAELRIRRLTTGYDCGRVIDPDGVEGQLRGATAMGVGATLYEELRYDEQGQPVATTFMDYLVPTLAEVPPVEVVTFEYPATGNPLGAKGAGEAGVIGVGAAVGGALADALGRAAAVTELPLRADRILAAEEGEGER